LKLAASQELFAYWTQLRGGRSAPERDEVDPGAIRGVLADTFILEVDESLVYPMRISGSRTNSLFQRELRGEPFLGLWRPQDRREVCEILTSVSDDAAPILAGVSAQPRGLPGLEFEVLLLPLRHHGDTHARILGCCAPKSNPQWLGLASAGGLSLISLRVLNRGASPTSGRRDQIPLSPAESLGFSRMPELNRHKHLHVVGGTDQSR
jgi:hypothetical protein